MTLSPNRHDLSAAMRRLRVCVIVPTYNNAGTLRRVVEELLEYTSDLIVVDDGCTDSTPSILSLFADRITVVTHSVNRGKGCALKSGFLRAMEMGYEYAVTIDSDSQHFPSDLPLFIRAIAENPGALVVGERDLTKVDINAKSSFANKFSNFWFALQTGRKLRDTQTGYRAYPLRTLHGLGLLTSRYEAELLLLVMAAWHGVPLVGIPIHVYYPPQAERVSHFRPNLDFTRISILNTLLCIGAVVYALPVKAWNSVAKRRLFPWEFTPFTRSKGTRREASLTLGRFFRSLYSISYFAFWTMGCFTPFTHLYFLTGKDTEEKRFRFHRWLCRVSGFLARQLPGASVHWENPSGETLERPAVVICNHQSHLDLAMLMAVSPRLVFLTNDWVANNIFYGTIIRHAEFLPVSQGLEALLPRLRNLTSRGYSVVIFPEGTRSADCSILRFHQGAFFLARELQLDILSMVLHGAGHYLPKKDFMLRNGAITLRTLSRTPFDPSDDTTLRRQASEARKSMRAAYEALALEKETAAYFSPLVLYKYAYRGWSNVTRCKQTLRDITPWHDIIDSRRQLRNVRILNSGIGTFALLYALVNPQTEVYAYESSLADHALASSTALLPPNLHFIHAVWESETMHPEGEEFDLTVHLSSRAPLGERSARQLHIPVKS